MSNQKSIREEITKRIVAALEKNLLPWRRPWVTSGPGRHSNAVTRRAYRGVNPLLLQIHAAAHGFCSQWWATFNQWQKLGCMVRRRPEGVEPGQWGCGIVVHIPITKEVENPDSD